MSAHNAGKFQELKNSVDGKASLRVDTSLGTRIFAGDTMIYGDTGWRNVTSLATNIVAGYGSIVFRQLNGIAHLIYDVQLDPSTTSSEIIPAGSFTAWSPNSPSPGAKGTATEVNTSRTYRSLLNRLGSLSIYGAPRGTVLNGDVMWTSDRPWPATLPGIPA